MFSEKYFRGTHHPEIFSATAFSDRSLIVSGPNPEPGKPNKIDVSSDDGFMMLTLYILDGAAIAAGSVHDTICIWDAQTGRARAASIPNFMPAGTIALSTCISPDQTRLALGLEDKTVTLWDTKSEQQIGIPLVGHTGGVHWVAFSRDGTRIISGSADKTIRMWDAMTGGAIGNPLEGHSDCVRSVVFSPDGRRIVSGSDDKTVRIWDVQTRECAITMEGHTDSVTSVAISPDGTLVASGSSDCTIRLWDIEIGRALGKLEGHSNYVYTVSFSPDGKCVFSSSHDKTVRVWEIEAL